MAENTDDAEPDKPTPTPTPTPADLRRKESQEPETDWKAESRKWESRAKANSQAAKALKEKTAAYDELKSESDDLRSRLAELEAEKQTAEWKRKVSQDTGVPEKLLRGDSEEQMREFAEMLSEWKAPKLPNGPKVGDPFAQPESGKRPANADAANLKAMFNTVN